MPLAASCRPQAARARLAVAAGALQGCRSSRRPPRPTNAAASPLCLERGPPLPPCLRPGPSKGCRLSQALGGGARRDLPRGLLQICQAGRVLPVTASQVQQQDLVTDALHASKPHQAPATYTHKELAAGFCCDPSLGDKSCRRSCPPLCVMGCRPQHNKNDRHQADVPFYNFSNDFVSCPVGRLCDTKCVEASMLSAARQRRGRGRVDAPRPCMPRQDHCRQSRGTFR